MQQKKVVKIAVLLALLIGLGLGIFFVVMQSVTDSPSASLCLSSYGYADNQYQFVKGTIFDYELAISPYSLKMGSFAYAWSVGDPRPIAGCTCGSISGTGLPNTSFGRSNPVTLTDSRYMYYCGCPVGSMTFPLAFKGGKLVAWGVLGEGNSMKLNDEVAYNDSEIIIGGCTSKSGDKECSNYDRSGNCVGYFPPYTQSSCGYTIVIPTERINFTFDNDKLMTFVGEDLLLPLKMYNGWDRSINGTLTIDMYVESPFGNASKTEVFKNFELPVGETTKTITIPTGNVAEFLYFRPTFQANLVNDVHYTGIHESCTSGSPIAEEIQIKKTIGDWERVVINPTPLFRPTINGDCDSFSGYELNEDGSFCIRDDIRSLGCMQVGCPVFENLTNEYFCTSAGICAEMVYKQGCVDDSDCEDFGAVCLDSAFEEKFCVKTEISEIIKDVPSPVYVEYTCDNADFVCASGFECVDWEVNGTKMATCQKETLTSGISDTAWMIIVGVLSLLAVVVVVLIFRKKGKKRR